MPVSLGQGQEHLGRRRCQGCGETAGSLVHERHVQEQQRQSDRKTGAVRDRSSSGRERFGPVRQLHFGERLQVGAVEPSEGLPRGSDLLGGDAGQPQFIERRGEPDRKPGTLGGRFEASELAAPPGPGG